MAANPRPKVDVYPHTNYVSAQRPAARKHTDQSAQAKLGRMKARFDAHGAIRSVEAVMLVHVHDHPHVLLLETTIGTNQIYRLPGGKCRRDEDEIECLLRKLDKKVFGVADSSNERKGPAAPPCRVGELLATWIRPNFDPLMYPYKPVHVTHEKEIRSVYLVHLHSEAPMRIPSDCNLVAVPLFELFDNAGRFGAVIAGVPHNLSRLHVNLC